MSNVNSYFFLKFLFGFLSNTDSVLSLWIDACCRRCHGRSRGKMFMILSTRRFIKHLGIKGII